MVRSAAASRCHLFRIWTKSVARLRRLVNTTVQCFGRSTVGDAALCELNWVQCSGISIYQSMRINGDQRLSRLKMGIKILEQKVSLLPVDVGLLQQVQKMHGESMCKKNC